MRFQKTHGYTAAGMKPAIYRTWSSMHTRCTNPKVKSYEHYGGRGISVCERWKQFANFAADMGPRPDGMSLDRIDNEGNYGPSNCRWATPKQQASNRRCKKLAFHGTTLAVAEWAQKIGITKQALLERLEKWPLARALGERAGARLHPPVMIVFRGERKNITQWAKALGIKKPTMEWRVRRYGAQRALRMAAPRVQS